MGEEGFNDLYQGVAITSRVQKEIDENFIIFNVNQL